MKNLFSVSYDDFEKKNGYLYIKDNLKCKKMWTTNRNFVFGFRMPQIAKFMGPTWGPPGSYQLQMGPMLAHEPCYQGHLVLKWECTGVSFK